MDEKSCSRGSDFISDSKSTCALHNAKRCNPGSSYFRLSSAWFSVIFRFSQLNLKTLPILICRPHACPSSGYLRKGPGVSVHYGHPAVPRPHAPSPLSPPLTCPQPLPSTCPCHCPFPTVTHPHPSALAMLSMCTIKGRGCRGQPWRQTRDRMWWW